MRLTKFVNISLLPGSYSSLVILSIHLDEFMERIIVPAFCKRQGYPCHYLITTKQSVPPETDCNFQIIIFTTYGTPKRSCPLKDTLLYAGNQ